MRGANVLSVVRRSKPSFGLPNVCLTHRQELDIFDDNKRHKNIKEIEAKEILSKLGKRCHHLQIEDIL